ncbi:MAG: hypothetical protein Q4E89_05150 [Eubacteriales bacterium]|nr:hypothetical protein [Eubacteriales bacterium]
MAKRFLRSAVFVLGCFLLGILLAVLGVLHMAVCVIGRLTDCLLLKLEGS